MLDSTRTTLGRSLLRTWLLRPSLSLEIINARHDAVECFTRPENIDIANVMHGQLKGIKNVPRVLAALRAGKAVLTDWQRLVKVRELRMGGSYTHATGKFTFHTAMLRDKLGEVSMGRDVDIVKKACALRTRHFRLTNPPDS
jgi:DNA mismatch repair protein MSH5